LRVGNWKAFEEVLVCQLEQIQFLGYVSVQTTEKYLGCPITPTGPVKYQSGNIPESNGRSPAGTSLAKGQVHQHPICTFGGGSLPLSARILTPLVSFLIYESEPGRIRNALQGFWGDKIRREAKQLGYQLVPTEQKPGVNR
jgi:hypothetical protein